mmetsp:Transcript_78473/g.230140  ORF Transcript_78473/g.230140 Transcript_78473/m.230140 type:complete len:351 (-) Transcript_78473:105-1157(-)
MPALTLEPYGKAVVVKGDTRPVKDFLKEKGGKWNKALVGWIFPGSRRSQLLEDLKGHGASVEDRVGGGEGGAAPAAQPAKRPAPAPEAPAASKRAKPEATTPAASGEVSIEITDKILGRVSSFAGSLGVDIRKFYREAGSDELRPTAKGIRLKVDEWQALLGKMPEVEAAVAGGGGETSVKVSEDVVVTIKPSEGGGSKSVDVRRFYVDRNDKELKPGKKGIFLSQLEWSGLKATADEISAALRSGGGSSAGAAPPRREAAAKVANASPPAATTKSSPDTTTSKQAPQGAPDNLRERLADLLRGRDLQAISLKQVRGELEASLKMQKGELDSRKEEIKGIVTDLLQRGVP